ncbi:MAG TPA: protein kinase [Polyangiaceae bacterium]|nr:protein kinase [Polyangiaceae bacterium]
MPGSTGESIEGSPSEEGLLRELAAAPAARPAALDVTSGGALRGSSRFAVGRCLGRGGFGTVYEAHDRERSADVALKILHRADPRSLYLFKQEFRAARELHHPGLVRLYELFADGERWYFTMELVRGKNLVEHLRAAAPPEDRDDSSGRGESPGAEGAPAPPAGEAAPPGRAGEAPPLGPTCDAMLALCDALGALHAAGKVHRDVKPQNALATPEGRVVLLDFGLLREASPEGGASSEVAGTPDYMSPEQAAGLALTPASDLYSVGVLLFEALTGARPFAGAAGAVLARQPREDGPAPSTLVGGLPADLDALCRDLLRARPEDRPGLDEVRARLARLRGEHAAARASPAPPSAPPSAPLVGRARHVAALRAAFDEAGEGRAVAVLCRGSSGAGKSALCRAFLRDLERQEPRAVVLSGRCFEHEQIPFKAVDGVVDALSRHLRRLPPPEAAALLPRDAFALRRVFPVLDQVPAFSAAPERRVADPQHLQRAAFGALREALQRLADRRRVVLFIDDLQWSDLDSVGLLVEALRPPDPPPLLLCATCREDDAEAAPLVAALRALGGDGSLVVRDLAVGELTPDEASALARSLLPSAPEAFARRVAEESRGNPFYVRELVAHAGPGGVPTVGDAIGRRVARLPDRARRLLELVCVAGQPLARAVAHAALDAAPEAPAPDAGAWHAPEAGARPAPPEAGAPPSPPAAGAAGELAEPHALALLRAERLLRTRTTPSGEHLVPYHDRVRESVVELLAPEARRARHLDLARALERHPGAASLEPERLMKHYASGGEPARAARYAVAAAGQAHAALAFARAARLYEEALASGELADHEARALRPTLGDAYAAAGRLRDAARAYQAAAAEAPGDEALRLTRLAMEQLVLGRDLVAGMALAARHLERAEIRLPSRPWRALLALLVARLRLGVRGLRFRERSADQVPPALLARIDTAAPVATTLGLLDPLRGAYLFTLHLLDTLRAGERNRLANALGLEAYLRAVGGRHASAARLVARTKALCAAGVTEETEALSEMGAAGALLEAGAFREALPRLRAAGARLRERLPGKHWAADIARIGEIRALWALGELRALEALLPEVIRDAHDRGSLLLASIAGFAGGCLALCQGRPHAAEEALRALRARPAEGALRDHIVELELSAFLALYHGRHAEVVALAAPLREGRGGAAALLRAQQQRITVATLRATAALVSYDLDLTPSRLREAEREARRLERERVPYAVALGLLFRGLARRRRGARAEAEALLARAESAFEAGGMRLYAACARLRRGELAAEAEGRALVGESEAWLSTQGAARPDRVCAMLAP